LKPFVLTITWSSGRSRRVGNSWKMSALETLRVPRADTKPKEEKTGGTMARKGRLAGAERKKKKMTQRGGGGMEVKLLKNFRSQKATLKKSRKGQIKKNALMTWSRSRGRELVGKASGGEVSVHVYATICEGRRMKVTTRKKTQGTFSSRQGHKRGIRAL